MAQRLPTRTCSIFSQISKRFFSRNFSAGPPRIPLPKFEQQAQPIPASALDKAHATFTSLHYDGEGLIKNWVGRVAPRLAEQAVSHVYGDVYGVGDLPVRYRELAIAAIVASSGAFQDGANVHLKLAMQEGATPGEIDNLFCLVAAYAGFPHALSAARSWQRELERNISDAAAPAEK
jgi:alkylhydroperoxidase/carboxymuconolactone decarboxylase family protein YurZ